MGVRLGADGASPDAFFQITLCSGRFGEKLGGRLPKAALYWLTHPRLAPPGEAARPPPKFRLRLHSEQSRSGFPVRAILNREPKG